MTGHPVLYNFRISRGRKAKKLNRSIPSSAVGAGFACPKTQSKLFSGERASPLQTKRQHYPRFDSLFFRDEEGSVLK